MTDPLDDDQQVRIANTKALQTLVRAIEFSQGQFSLILLRCNHVKLQHRVEEQLRELTSVNIRVITLDPSNQTLYTAIRKKLCNECPNALMVFGLESIESVRDLLVATNQVREEFRKNFPFPMMIWISDDVLKGLIRFAPDFESWSSTIQFEVALSALIIGLRHHTDRLFESILSVGDEHFLPNWAVLQQSNVQTWGTNSLRRTELASVLDRVLASGQTLDPALQASLDFLLGQDVHAQGELEIARTCYEHSLAFWQEESKRQRSQKLSEAFVLLPSASERAACVLIHLGLWWRSQAMQQRGGYANACQQALNYFRLGLQMFEQANRQDLVARFIIPQAEALQKLQQWRELETLAKHALVLHKLYPDPVRQARDHGFLAEVALARSAWMEAKQQVETALQLLVTTAATLEQTSDPSNSYLEHSLEVAQRYHQGWYLLLLAKAEANLGRVDAAITHLETAQNQTYPPDDPQLYITILRQLRNLYFQKGRYLEAFHTKQLQRSLEHQYGFRAFVGALRLEPQQSLFSPIPGQLPPEAPLAQEIKASGRQQDVSQLERRIKHPADKLTVIHGPSGVGKSSLLSAGLLPALEGKTLRTRYTIAIMVDLYVDWSLAINRKLVAALGKIGFAESITVDSNKATYNTLEILRENQERGLLTVLIFDQFEEFFFVHKTLQQRRLFYEFLRDCLNLDFVKVVLTLREDYLHYLLEFQRLASRDSINLDSINDILGKDIRYRLGDFSPADTRSIIKSLTDHAQFYLDDALVEALVEDLAGNRGEVRAIELQAVGAELQAEGITTLAEYRQNGPKERLVARSLENIIEDCGSENEDAARIVLFLLTNENGTRPLKSREDLETDLVDFGLTTEISKLDLVLEVLIGSGLLFLVPENPANRYQLVHDYLVSFIRRQQEEIVADLKQHDRYPTESSEPEPVVKRRINLRQQNTFLKSKLKQICSIERVPSVLLFSLALLLFVVLATHFKPQLANLKHKRVKAVMEWQAIQAPSSITSSPSTTAQHDSQDN